MQTDTAHQLEVNVALSELPPTATVIAIQHSVTSIDPYSQVIENCNGSAWLFSTLIVYSRPTEEGRE